MNSHLITASPILSSLPFIAFDLFSYEITDEGWFAASELFEKRKSDEPSNLKGTMNYQHIPTQTFSVHFEWHGDGHPTDYPYCYIGERILYYEKTYNLSIEDFHQLIIPEGATLHFQTVKPVIGEKHSVSVEGQTRYRSEEKIPFFLSFDNNMQVNVDEKIYVDHLFLIEKNKDITNPFNEKVDLLKNISYFEYKITQEKPVADYNGGVLNLNNHEQKPSLFSDLKTHIYKTVYPGPSFISAQVTMATDKASAVITKGRTDKERVEITPNSSGEYKGYLQVHAITDNGFKKYLGNYDLSQIKIIR